MTLDANGYTHVTPSSDTKTIYVSSSQGNDSNSGLSPDSPVRTINRGISLLRSGSPDWLVLKKGDTFTEAISWTKSGRSSNEPMVFGTYGTGDRPLIKASANTALYSPNGIQNVDIMGLHFQDSTRDPNSPDYDGNINGDIRDADHRPGKQRPD